jgi:hypothetical protein
LEIKEDEINKILNELKLLNNNKKEEAVVVDNSFNYLSMNSEMTFSSLNNYNETFKSLKDFNNTSILNNNNNNNNSNNSINKTNNNNNNNNKNNDNELIIWLKKLNITEESINNIKLNEIISFDMLKKLSKDELKHE